MCAALCSLGERVGVSGNDGIEAKLAEYQRKVLNVDFSEEVDSESTMTRRHSILKTLKNLKTGSSGGTMRRDQELEAFKDRVNDQLAEHKR